MRIRSLLAASAALLTLAGVSSGARAQNLNALLAGCAALPTQQARMECYEGVSRGAGRGGGSVAPAPAAGPASATPATGVAAGVPSPTGFGSDSFKRPASERRRDQGTTRIEARVTSASDNGIGHWTIVLDDGATWRMTQADPSFQPPRPNDIVAIRRGAMGGYLMDVQGQASVYVTRIQ